MMNVLEESFLETETFAKISGRDQQPRLNYSYEAAESYEAAKLSPRKSELRWETPQ
ncbi:MULTISPECIES: hypothetical protein [Methanosarcina]|uniref:Uncharacterized protein n=1 Tax=Methanosarcina barkeri CM1 TaxID=796385 RepID=A0A0G3CHF3_METBA|nr:MULTISPECIES: hypothetical protein [Methanosarcina]AKJ38547.1 hypothetical protein MCM1_1507 [Methanosarcina barkeri CM1]